MMWYCTLCVFFFKQKTAYDMRISDWSSDVCSSDLRFHGFNAVQFAHPVVFGQQGITVFTAIDQRLRAVDITQMTVTALTADQRGDGGELAVAGNEIGRASCRERVCQYV